MVVRALNRSTRAIYTATHPRKPAKTPISGPAGLPNPADEFPKLTDAVRKVIEPVPKVNDVVRKVIVGVQKVIDAVRESIYAVRKVSDAVQKVIGAVRKVTDAVPSSKRPLRPCRPDCEERCISLWFRLDPAQQPSRLPTMGWTRNNLSAPHKS